MMAVYRMRPEHGAQRTQAYRSRPEVGELRDRPRFRGLGDTTAQVDITQAITQLRQLLAANPSKAAAVLAMPSTSGPAQTIQGIINFYTSNNVSTFYERDYAMVSAAIAALQGTQAPTTDAATLAALRGADQGNAAAIAKHNAPSGNFFSQASSFVENVAAQLDRYVLAPVYQPVAHPIGHALDQFAVAVVRPTIKGFEQAEAALDTYVPGWAVLVDVIGPVLPFVPLLSNALAAAAQLTPEVTAALFDAVQTAGGQVSGAVSSEAAPVLSRTFQLESYVQQQIVQASSLALQAKPGVDALAPVQATLLKATQTFQATQGTLLDKLGMVSLQVLQGVSLALTLAATILTAGAAAPAVVSILAGVDEVLGVVVISVVQAAEIVANAAEVAIKLAFIVQAAQQLHAAARAAKAAANAQAAELQAQADELEREIAELQAERAAVARSSRATSPATSNTLALVGLVLAVFVVSEATS
jgi:hypothetical protein